MSISEALAAPTRPKLLRQFSTTVIDQVVLSAANFFIGFLLIRRTSDIDYGMFVLVQSAITLLISLQASMVSSPLAVFAPARPLPARREMIGAIEASHRRFLMRLATLLFLVPLAGYWWGYWNTLQSLVIGLGILACWTALRREFQRGVLLIHSRPDLMLRADLVNVGILVVGAVVAAYGPKPAVLWAVGALILSAFGGEYVARRALGAAAEAEYANAASYWREIRPLAFWATVGAMTYWAYSQSYNYVLASRVNLTAVADVNAARLLLMPTIVLTVGIKTLLVPTAAGWLAESSVGKLVRRLLWFATGVALIDMAYCLVLWMLRDWLTADVLHKNIANRDVLLFLWATLSLIALYRDLLQTGLFALRQFRSLAGVTAISAVISLSIMFYGIKIWGAAAALIGQVAGELVNLAGVCGLLIAAYFHSKKIPKHVADG